MIESANSIAKTYDLIRWLMPIISRFPKCKRYTLGQRIEDNLLDILALLLEANYSKEKLNILKHVNLKLEVFRYLIRLSHDLHFINIRRYEFISKETNRIGRLIGGWIKQQTSR